MDKVLIIQTAFIGDVILATALIESIHKKNPETKIDFLLRKGNESLLKDHPFINEVIIWDKKAAKYKNLFKTAKHVRSNNYDTIFNLQRFGSTGYLTWKSGARKKVGFKKNPFSFSFTHKVEHEIGNGLHEVERNKQLLDAIGEFDYEKPKLYPSKADFSKIEGLFGLVDNIVLAPSSVWFTKQMPQEKWLDIIDIYDSKKNVILIGGPGDKKILDQIVALRPDRKIKNTAGQLSLLESAALISKSDMTHVNDSAPLHLCSAMNADVQAYFCSTIPDFGFGPLSPNSRIVETTQKLDCRPCGLHGHKECPKGHFKCGNLIDVTI